MSNVIELDNRGLQPPAPLTRILDALDRLGSGDSVVAINDREPLLLYPMLQERGFSWTVKQGADGAFTIRIVPEGPNRT